ncbi:putative two-component system hydrogenase maturation factor HypX/HoxX [Actinoplanes lutulentus]|uniref:Putative two-component system hydrogenase maturation factor HypX/HoxX n=1 Tax=Actinoplanes lutulentus TaxID=1287878 RepID=A0A327ZHY6_9ACTN|nr:hydrogenase maturation protein [Actinoplanes lutulentus]MBB2945524.1 putative two-component system hydrogenase maturation factor HypX/HoxX [Actinoplanes lutulentus]RAK40344.1 putative two-component system hydrogenase maturation factor HypX/HoxX [Actinoplanes lutulentus]
MRILLLVSAFNGLSQRVWCALREAGHEVGVLLATSDRDVVDGVTAVNPDLVLCPYLKERIPDQVWQRWRTVVLHPGPVGDRGPSSLDWAISESAPSWGVTAIQAVEELDGGPIWATRTFPMPAAAPRKSALYAGPVSDAAMECVFEVVAKAGDPSFVPASAEDTPAQAPGARPRPPMRQADRVFEWSEPSETILRRIRASDGSPGVRAMIGGLDAYVYDAHPGMTRGARPGRILKRRQGAVLVATGDGSLWIGHLRPAEDGGIKLPATTALGARLHGVPHSQAGPADDPETPYAYRQVRYRRTGAVGWLNFDFYNGAMAPGHSRRLLAGLRHAVAQDTRALVLRGGTEAFSNGIHLNVIEGSSDPSGAAWAAIRAINEVCREIITCTRQVVVAAYAGSAGAGGVMLGLGADIIAARDGIVLNPYYDMGLFGSELHTFSLPRRVGADAAQRLIDDRLPVSTAEAARIGLVDEVGPRHPEAYAGWLAALAEKHGDVRASRKRRAAKARRLAAERIPLDVYETRELAEMSRDIYTDRSGFAAARHAFVRKLQPEATPRHLLFAANAGAVTGGPAVNSGPVTAGRQRNNSGPAVERRPALRPSVPVSA